MMDRVWAAGSVHARADVRPSLAERAFRYGDGVFATLRLRNGLLLDARAHVERLATSASSVGLALPDGVGNVDGVVAILTRLGARPDTDCVVRIQVSAGTGGRGYGRGTRGDAAGAGWELVELLPPPPERRLTLTLLDDGAVPPPAFPSVKSCSALAHVMCARLAARSGCEEAVRVSGGSVLEACAANLFWTAGTTLFTPSAELPLYAGVTRSVVLAVAEAEGWAVRQGRFPPSAVSQAEAVFLTNATRGIERVAVLDGAEAGWPAAVESLRSAAERAREDGATDLAGQR